jgi:hypothetical protein
MEDRATGQPKGRRGRRFWALCALGALAALAALGTAINSFAGPVGNAIGFEDDDANLVVNSTFDWNGFAPVTWSPHPSSTPTRQTVDKTVSGFKFKGIEDWQATTSDTSFNGGVKQDDNCAGVGAGKAPNKDDLKRIYLASKTGANGHTYLELAWARIPQNTTSASAHVGFEFNQGSTACGAGSNGLVQRTAGDVLIVYDFEGGSATPVLTLRRWVTSGSCEVGSSSPPCWGPATNLTAGGFAEGAVNVGAATTLDQLAPPALSSTTGISVDQNLGESEFGEAGVDLTAAGVFPAGRCVTFGKAYAVSRSSGNSAQAQMKDLVGPADFRISNCGQIKIIKRTDPRGVNQDFSYTSTIPAAGSVAAPDELCSSDSTPASFTLNDNGNTNSDSAANTEHCTNVPAGSYTVTEGADPANFEFADLSCTASGTGTSASPSSGNATRTATITLAGDGSVTCVYTNRQKLGAIKVTKTRKHAADGPGDHPHAGVSFTVNGVTKQTDANGVACFDGLAFASYTVHEAVPAGYHVDANDKSVTVDNSATCSDSPYVGETVSFHNTPLTDITMSVDSQVDGGTASSIDCGGGATGSTNANGDGSVSRNDLEPGTYTCTVVIDP